MAFVSTPSLFFGLSEKERRNCRVLDYDEGLGDDVIKYDFNEPTTVPDALRGAFHCAVIDPPFITADVWKKYAETAKLLLRPGGLVVLTTVIENSSLLADIFPGDELRNWRHLPASLQLDVACRVAFLPFAAVVLAVALSVLDAQTAD